MKEDFWDDSQKAQGIVKKAKVIENRIERYEEVLEAFDDLKVMLSMVLDEEASEFENEVLEAYQELNQKVEKYKLDVLLDGEYDHLNAIIAINAGSGGLDAQEWAEMLLRMYTKWAESRGYSVEVLDYINDKEGGIKTATIKVNGENAFGFAKSEKGVHRLVRISPFDSAGKRHTSFASVDVVPEIDSSVDVEIDPNDLKIDTYRASGAGGQHVNTTDSAVRITHLPTGVVVQCQNQRSQLSNKKTALNILKGKLLELKEQEQKDEIKDLMGNYSEITWGNQIRSYVFNPYKLVKDHRTNYEISNVDAVMDGGIDEFIIEYLKWSKDA